ncbi:MAG TPA: PilZ domain-containing protein [Lachnospiraceae bacterium]|nr:PilZ domain-containing protein [Lachnospiraceae bacterium]
MEEKRKNRRMELEAHLIMKRIDSGKNEKIPVDVLNLSKTGIGFKCEKLLEINSVYEAELIIWTREIIHTFIDVTRFDNSGDDNIYGALFIGMPESDACKIEIYDMFDKASHK